MEGKRKLFTIEDTFQISGRGVVAIPGPVFNVFGTGGRTHSCSVEVKRPDGSTLITQAHFYVAFLSPAEAQKRYLERGCYECLFQNIVKSDIPIGSDVWTASD